MLKDLFTRTEDLGVGFLYLWDCALFSDALTMKLHALQSVKSANDSFNLLYSQPVLIFHIFKKIWELLENHINTPLFFLQFQGAACCFCFRVLLSHIFPLWEKVFLSSLSDLPNLLGKSKSTLLGASAPRSAERKNNCCFLFSSYFLKAILHVPSSWVCQML